MGDHDAMDAGTAAYRARLAAGHGDADAGLLLDRDVLRDVADPGALLHAAEQAAWRSVGGNASAKPGRRLPGHASSRPMSKRIRTIP
jgi:hypothetical protein